MAGRPISARQVLNHSQRDAQRGGMGASMAHHARKVQQFHHLTHLIQTGRYPTQISPSSSKDQDKQEYAKGKHLKGSVRDRVEASTELVTKRAATRHTTEDRDHVKRKARSRDSISSSAACLSRSRCSRSREDSSSPLSISSRSSSSTCYVPQEGHQIALRESVKEVVHSAQKKRQQQTIPAHDEW